MGPKSVHIEYSPSRSLCIWHYAARVYLTSDPEGVPCVHLACKPVWWERYLIISALLNLFLACSTDTVRRTKWRDKLMKLCVCMHTHGNNKRQIRCKHIQHVSESRAGFTWKPICCTICTLSKKHKHLTLSEVQQITENMVWLCGMCTTRVSVHVCER